MRLHDAEPVAQPEVQQAARPQHPADVGQHGVRVDDVLVDVVEDRDVDALVGPGQRLAGRQHELDPVAEPLARHGQARLVDVDAVGVRRAGPGEARRR
ncbi:hypothetical protein GCM10025868_36650 [Angustibacter aerolatus]|uniref:Uncharacterized protein n=1 Tax=Angustibacter aerolatus TaxID=1162965 RepID=A0ABQ6JME1_9ACTN|nr:hypothetical protein GCM10025868_36650 [Angustibacter aerolatus]